MLFTSKLASELTPVLASADEVWVAVALLNEYGVQFLKQHLPPTATLHLLVGLDLPTTPAALKQVLAWQTVTVRLHGGSNTYHPKVYVVRQGERYTAFIGSANATAGGLAGNVELSAIIPDAADVRQLLDAWWKPLFAQGKALSAAFIEDYAAVFAERAAIAAQLDAGRNRVRTLLAQLAPPPSTKALAGQFFQEIHFRAFARDRWRAQDALANADRIAVRRRFYKLHDQLVSLIHQQKRDLHFHYVVDNQVSAAVHGVGVEPELKAMWLNFGRSKPELKAINEAATPKEFLRLEVILFEESVETWCRIGRERKVADRQYLHNSMRQPAYRQQVYESLQALGDDFCIEVAGTERVVTGFSDASELGEFIRPDEIGGHYLIIRHRYAVDDLRISKKLFKLADLLDAAKAL